MAHRVKIGNRWVGEQEPIYLIAEAGSNHNGSLEQALRLIELAVSAGVDAVKFQLFRAERLYPKNAGSCDYLKIQKSIYQIIQEREVPYEWLPTLANACRERGVQFFASVFDEESADRLDPHVEVFKIASYEMTHWPLIRHVAKKGKPVILSTGTATLKEVEQTVAEFNRTGNQNLLLMQCTAAYPAPVESLNLRAMETLRSAFQVPVGLSDHSRDPLVGPLAAVALGANLLEKHFTLSNELPGPDHRFAVEPKELQQMVEKVRAVEKALGNGLKQLHAVEEELYHFARRHLFAILPLQKGARISPENARFLRKGKHLPGIPPGRWEQVLGRPVNRDLEPDEPIREGDLA